VAGDHGALSEPLIPYCVFRASVGKGLLAYKGRDEIFPSGTGEVRFAIFSRSLAVMSATLRRDIYDLGNPGFPADKVKQPEQDLLAMARIRASIGLTIYVIVILESVRVRGTTSERVGVDDKFLREKYLYWLEALSILRSMSEGVRAMAKLEVLLYCLILETL
jgi:hypothetical protein